MPLRRLICLLLALAALAAWPLAGPAPASTGLRTSPALMPIIDGTSSRMAIEARAVTASRMHDAAARRSARNVADAFGRGRRLALAVPAPTGADVEWRDAAVEYLGASERLWRACAARRVGYLQASRAQVRLAERLTARSNAVAPPSPSARPARHAAGRVGVATGPLLGAAGFAALLLVAAVGVVVRRRADATA